MMKNQIKIQLEGNRKSFKKKDYYNLDMIISIGFRVNFETAIKFRMKQDREYISSVDEMYKKHLEKNKKQ